MTRGCLLVRIIMEGSQIRILALIPHISYFSAESHRKILDLGDNRNCYPICLFYTITTRMLTF